MKTYFYNAVIFLVFASTMAHGASIIMQPKDLQKEDLQEKELLKFYDSLNHDDVPAALAFIEKTDVEILNTYKSHPFDFTLAEAISFSGNSEIMRALILKKGIDLHINCNLVIANLMGTLNPIVISDLCKAEPKLRSQQWVLTQQRKLTPIKFINDLRFYSTSAKEKPNLYACLEVLFMGPPNENPYFQEMFRELQQEYVTYLLRKEIQSKIEAREKDKDEKKEVTKNIK